MLLNIFEKAMYVQLYDYMNQLLCGFHKTHSTQHALFRLIQSWQIEFDESGFVGTILMDLSKGYDCLPHDPIVAKLEGYGLAKESLQLISDYLSYGKQRKKIGSAMVIGSISFAEFLNAPFWVLYFLMFLLMIFFLSLKSQTFTILQITLCIPMAATFL